MDKTAAKGDVFDAQKHLANSYERGRGVIQDYQTAFKWVKLASEDPKNYIKTIEIVYIFNVTPQHRISVTNTAEHRFQNGITILILKAEFLTMRFLRAYCRRSVHQ